MAEARDPARAAMDALLRTGRLARVRAAIVGSWAALALATVWLACPSSGAGNRLGAEVRLVREPLLGLQLLVRNESGRNWEDVVLTLDGAWTAQRGTLRAGDRVVLAVGQFRRGAEPPPPAYVPRALDIRCAQGAHRADLEPRDAEGPAGGER